MDALPLRCPTCGAGFDAGSSFCNHDGARLLPATGDGASLVGSILAERYRIVKLLGEGGMGRVYEAQHVNINKRLAIKVLRPEVTSAPSTVARFRQEARSASSIGHENIIEIEDFATLPDGTVYLAMELLEGESLGDRMREPPPLTLTQSMEIMIQVGRGLAAAHEKGIVHRDMKPENVFLARKGGRVVPKILDFGIAKVQGADGGGGTHLTQTGAIFGTPLYMSPEQAMGQALDHRADIYSCGVILYELAVGRVPFKADSAVQVLSQHITVTPEPPSRAAPERHVPVELDAIILRAMAKDPAARQPKMADLVAELQALARTLPAEIPATAPQSIAFTTPPDIAATQQKSKPPLYLALLLLLLGLGGGALWWLRKPAPPLVADKPPVETQPELVEVVVGTVPTGAKLLRDGKLLLETPDVVKVPPGQTWNVVLKKDGYVDQPLTIDPARERKMLVKLEAISRPAPSRPAPPSKPASKHTSVAKAAPPPPIAAPPPPPPPKPVMVPVAPPRPVDPVNAAVERLAAKDAPGAKRVAPIYAGHANEEDEHNDWFMTLEPGRCYDFVATGGPGVEELYVYLWGPNGKRATDRMEGSPSVTLHYCAQVGGSYHFQAKVAGGHGEFRMGLYKK